MTRSFVLLTLLRIFGMVLSLAYSLMLARLAGPDSYAVVQLFMSFCLFASLFLTAGFESVTVRFGSQYWKAENRQSLETVYAQARNTIALHSLLFSICILAAVAAGLDTPLTQGWLVGVYVIAGTVLHAFNAIHRDLLRASDRVAASMYSQNLVRAILPVVMTGAIALVSVSLLTRAMNLSVFMIALACGFAFEILLLRPLRVNLLAKFDKSAIDHSGYARRIFIGDIAHIGVYRLSSLAIGLVFDLRLAALYFAAERIAAMSQFVVEGVHISSGPSIAIAAETGVRQNLQNAISHASLLAFITGVPLMVVMAIAGPFVLGLFGPSFPDAYPELLVLLLGYGAMSLFGPTPMFGNMTGLEKQRAWTTYLALIFVVVSLGAAIVVGSIFVAACGAGFSLLFLHGGMAIVLWKKFGVISGPLGFRRQDIVHLIDGSIASMGRIIRKK